MLVIRLARQGRNKYPVYRIVAAESARAVTGKFVAVLGHYNPHTKELVIQKEETVKHLSNGAQPSNSVIKLLQRENIEVPGWVKLKTKNRKPKHEPEVKDVSSDEAVNGESPVAEAEVGSAPAVEKPEAAEQVDAPTEEPTDAPVVAVAEENAEAIAENITEAAPEDTAAGEAAQAEAVEDASEAAAEVAAEPAE